MARIASLVVGRPRLTLLAVGVVTLIALLGVFDLTTGTTLVRIDPALERLLADGGEQRAELVAMRERFGSDQQLLLVLGADDVFASDVLTRVVRLTDELSTIDGVRGVASLANAPEMRGQDGTLVVESLLRRIPSEPAELERMKRLVLDNPVYAGHLVSADARSTALVIELEDMSEGELEQRSVIRNIRAVVAAEQPHDAWLTGVALVKSETARILLEDLRVVVPAAFTVAILVAALSFRSLTAVVVPISGIAIALVWALACLVAVGGSLNLVTVTVPPLIVSIGFSYTTFLFASYDEIVARAPEMDHDAAVSRALRDGGGPIFLAALTDCAGLAALGVSPFPAVREFGWLGTLGVTLAVMVALTYVPAMLCVVGRGHRARARRRATTRADEALAAIARFATRHRRWVLGATAVLALVCAFGIARIEVGNDFIAGFRRGTPVRDEFEAVDARLHGANPFSIVLEADERGYFRRVEGLTTLVELQDWLTAQPEVGATQSVADHVRLLNWAFNDNDPAYRVLPVTDEAADELLFFGAGATLQRLADKSYRRARVVVRATTTDTRALRDLFARIRARLRALPPGVSGAVVGELVLATEAADDVARGQTESLLVGLLAVYVLLVVLFASARVGLIAMIPTILPILVLFATVGLAGLPLTTVTGLASCIVLGVAVDGTIHLMARFSELAREHADEERGIGDALRELGRPMTITTLALGLGFLTLALSRTTSQVQFGLLSAFSLLVSWVLNLVVTPALCSGLRVVTLWDVLNLDLGRDVQGSLPVLAGLRGAQAKIVALMTRLRVHPAGERLLSHGEGGDEVYMVIDGELAAVIERAGTRTALARFGRGDVVGEIALFGGRRTADVEVVADARLISLARDDLDRLRRRYPRIAAIVYRNLASILAERVARTTARLRDGD